MVKPKTTCLGVEYLCFPEDEIWRMPDADAVELAKGRIGLLDPELVTDGVKVRVPRAYPMYDDGYRGAQSDGRRRPRPVVGQHTRRVPGGDG